MPPGGRPPRPGARSAVRDGVDPCPAARHNGAIFGAMKEADARDYFFRSGRRHAGARRIKSICVYCGSAQASNLAYEVAARSLGLAIAPRPASGLSMAAAATA